MCPNANIVLFPDLSLAVGYIGGETLV